MPRAQEMAGVSAFRRSSPAVADPPVQGYSVSLPLSPPPGLSTLSIRDRYLAFCGRGA